MRPPKVLLCAGSDEWDLSRRVFFLETRGYRVVRAGSVAEMLAKLNAWRPGGIDALVVQLPLPELEAKTLDGARTRHPELRIVMTSDEPGYNANWNAEVYLPRAGNTPAELLERIRVLTTRKRGPKKVLRPVLDASRREVA